MEPFESTIESPLRFLFSYLKCEGESYLHRQFVSADEIDFNYIPARDVIYVQKILPRNTTRGEILEEKTNTCEYELTFSEFVQQEFDQQLKITKGLIYQKSTQNGDDQDKKLYKHILLNCLDFQISIDKSPELNFRPELNKFISQFLKYAYSKFEKYYPKTLEIQRVKRYYERRSDSNYTGFKLKPPPRNAPLKDTVELMFIKEFVTKHTKSESIHQFFNGEIPKPEKRIDWNKDLHELKFFIDQIYNDDILEKKKKQQWKYIKDVFTCNGEDLEEDWHRNHNKLKDVKKRQGVSKITAMLLPKQ